MPVRNFHGVEGRGSGYMKDDRMVGALVSEPHSAESAGH